MTEDPTMTEDPLDAAIDAVAREMTAGEQAGAADFRGRVLDGIDRSAAAGAWWRRAWVAAPLAAAGAIAIAVVMFQGTVRPKPDTTDAPMTVRLKPDNTEPPTVRRPPDTTDAPTKGRRRAPVEVAQSGPERRSSAENPQGASVLAAVAPPPRLAIAPIDVAPLGAARLEAADSIQLRRLDAITPIDVMPLGLDDSQRRDE